MGVAMRIVELRVRIHAGAAGGVFFFMSYLDRPRLHFFGQFTANPSTINNTPANYGMPLPYTNQSVPGQNPPPGFTNWNQNGRHNFSLDNCAVTSLVMDGDPGPVSGTVNASQAGVLVDLDTQQQLVSQIIGMQLTVTVGDGSVTGTFMANNFVDINFGRITGSNDNAQGDGAAGAAYQSVLTDLVWNEGSSKFLQTLKSVSSSMLSIRMNVDAHHGIFGQPEFTTGRVAGTIGPYFADEPLTFTNARFLRVTTAAYAQGWNAVPARYDAQRAKLIVDLGNATPWTWSEGAAAPTSAVTSVQVATIAFTAPNLNVADTIPTAVDTSDAAYQLNAFVQELDVPESMAQAVASTPLGIVSDGNILITENPTGAYVNAEPYVFRLNPGDSPQVTLWANTFQTPAASVLIALSAQNTQLINQQSGGPAPATLPGCSFPQSVTTDANGKATFTISATDPQNPRGPIPGQVYGIGWTWDLDLLPDQWNFISVKVFDAVPVPDQPTWWNDVYPILAQYAYLYPAMQAMFNLNDYDAVVKNATEIIARLNLPDDSPGQMPITRELSASQKAIILKWAGDPAHPAGGLPVPPATP
ncbi:MAG TPA: hypothetical protein VEK57_10950 [Thermoanaerobaculia bacterium]|nr:hypothetical protein [Thermoanaerobaculia bacterium]